MPTALADAPAPAIRGTRPDLTLGYVPLSDAAPLVVAEAKGFFRSAGLNVAIVAAPSWSTLRDRIAFGQWDGGQMLAPMPLAASLGLGGLQAELHVTTTLGRNGNTVVLGESLMSGATSPAPFPLPATALARILDERRTAGGRVPTLAVVFPFSAHTYLLRHYLASGGIDPDLDVRMVALPPPELPEALASGLIDGFCAGEPWGSRAVDLRVGRIVLGTGDIWRDHLEKVLAFPAARIERDPDAVLAATAAVLQAIHWLCQAENREEAARLLHARMLPGVPADVVALALQERLVLSPDSAPRAVPGALRHDVALTRPAPAHADWFAGQMRRWGHTSRDSVIPTGRLWRPDLWDRAMRLAALDHIQPAAGAMPPSWSEHR